MNEELKALLKEAYDRGASREQLDAIVERYNASKKKEQPQEPFQFGASDTPSAVPSQDVPEVKQHKKSFLDYLSESSPIGAGPADLRETTALRDQPKLMDILKENPEYGNKMVNRSVAAAKTGILLAESDAGLRSVDFEELADIQKIIQQNQPEEGDLFYNNNDGFVGFMYDLARTLPESFISMASAAETPLTAGSVAVGATAGSVIPGVGTAVGASSGFAFATSAINEYGTTIMAMLDEEGVDVTSADELRKAFADQELIGRIKKRAGARSGVIGLIDGISGGVAGKLSKKIVGEVGEEVIEELAKGTTKEIIDQATAAGRKITYGEVVETTIESLAGGAGEALGSIAAGQEVSLRDVLLETLADPTSKVVSTGGSKAQSLIDGVSKNLEGNGNITEAQKTLLKLAKNDPQRFQDVIAASQYRNNGEIKAINAKIAAIKLSSDFGQDKSLDKVIGTLQRRKANLQLRTMTELRGATQENINELAEIGREIEDLNTKYKDGSLTGDALAAVKEAINEKLVEFNDKYKEFATDVPAEVGAEAGAVDLEPVTKPEEEVKIDRTLFSDEDTKAVNELEKELVTAVEAKDTKKVQELTTAIIEIENKYRDSKKETGVPSPKQEGETAIKEEPVKEGGVETPETGRVVQELEEVTDAESFSKAIDDARDELSKDERRLDLQVSPVEPKAAKKIVSEGGKIFMSPDRMAGGFVEKDGYIGGIFKDPRSKAKAVAKNVIKQALDNGGKYLDAYATKLEDIYIDLGFRPVARIPFAEEFAPEGWDAPNSVLKDKPDVVFFVYDPENAKGTAGQGTEFTSYDIAKQFASERADQVAAAEDSLELDIILLDKDGARKEASRGAGSDPRNLVRGKMTATFTKDGIIFRTKEDTGRMKSKGGEIFIPNFKINTMPRIWDYERGTPEYAYYVANMMDIADKYEGDPVKLMESKRVKTEDIGKEGTPSARRFNAAKGKAITNMVSNFNKVLKKIGAAPVDIIFVNNSIEYATNYKYITSNEPTGSPRGVYISAGETIDGGAKIIINLDKADVSTIAHEMLHAYIGAVKLDGKKITEFATSMEAELSKGTPAERELAGRLSAFRDQYVKAEVYGKGKTKEDPIIAEEFLAEYVGIMSEHSEGLSPAKQVSFVDKVRSAVVKFLAKLGIVDKSLASKITNREEAFEFMNGFVDALQGRVEAIKPPAVEKNVNTATKFARYSIKGDFTHTYFDKSEQYQKLVDDGKIVHNSSLGNIAGKAATITQPDSMVTAKVELDGKTIVDGNGGIFFIAKFGDVWAAAKKQAANGLAKMINDSRKKNGGTGYLLLTSGAISKMITSTDGVKASMNILESMVERGLIPVSDFRAALTAVGKKYNVDFSGRDSMKSIHKDIQDKFLNVSDSTFEKRGFFFEDVVDHIAKNSPTAKENITAIRNMLGAQKRISFSKQGIKDAIGYVLAERIIDNLPSGHIYAYVEVNDEVIVEETKDHGSYPFVIKQKNGERPVLHLLSERPKAVEVVNAKDGSSVSDYDKTSMFQGKIGLAQAGRGSVIVKADAGAAEVSPEVKQQIDFTDSELLNEFSWTEEVFEDGKFKKVTKTEKSDKPIAIRFPDGVVAVVRSRKDDLAAAEQMVRDVKKGMYPYMDIDEAKAKRDRIRRAIKDKDVVIELVDGDMKYHKGTGYGRSAMPIGKISLVNNHYDYYFPEVAKLLGEDYKAGLMYSPDDTRAGDAVYIYDEFQGKGFGSRLYFSALRLLREQYPGARLISNHDFNVKKKAKNFWRSQVNNGLARVVANTATEKEIAKVGPEVLKQLKDIGAEYTGDIYELLDPAESTAPSKQYDVVSESTAKQQIDWQPSLFGRGQVNPAIVNRTTPVQEAALELLQGKITNDDYQEVVRTTQAIEPITKFFLPASTKDMQESLDSNKAKLLNTPLEDGTAVGLRLDIPAYKNRNIWVVSIHDSGKAGKSLSYGSVAWATDVTFGSNPKVAAFIAAGQNLDTLKKQDKTTIARMHGKWKNFEGKSKEDRDASAVKKVEEIVAIESSFPGAGRKGSPWRQIGMNPFRHSYFYDRRNGKPVVGASEVVQIGGLVYAKDVLYADKNDMTFEVSGYTDANGDPVRFQLELDDMQIQPAVYKKNIFQKIASQFVFTNVEKQARILFESKQGQVTLAVREARDLARKIRKLANSEELVEMVSNYMEGNNRGEIADKLEKTENGERLLDLLRNADAMVEGFSESIVDDPAFESLPIELKFAITNNAGTYLKTRYRFFTDKKYKIKDKARAKAIQSERDMIVAREMAVMKRAGLSEDQINEAIQDSLDDINKRAHDSIDLYINKLENIKQAPSVTGTDIKIPSSSFQFKKDIPYHIQELLGVERDPVSRFSATVEAQANILYKGRMVQGLLETASGLWDEYILDSDPEPSKAPLYKKVKDPYSPLNNKWVHNEIMSIFDRAPLYESDKAWLQGYYSLLKLGRKSKVIWNIPTWRKNLTGGWYFMLANGVLANPRAAKDLKDRLALTLNSDRIMTDPQTKEWLNVMGKKGLLGANVDAQLIGINDAAYTYMYDGDAKAYEKAWRRVRSSVSNMDKWLQEKYSAVDDYTKLVIFRQEVDSFAKKIYGKEYESLTEPQKDRVHDEAAEFVKQNTPTFSRLPKFYDKLAVIPIFGDFASFQLESIRSMSMNIKNGISDMKIAIEGIDENGNKLNEEQKKAYKASAGKRLVGTLSAFALKYAMVAGFEQIFLDEEDEELAKDAKQVTPEWMKGQSLIVRSIDKNGDVRVYNYSSEDPYGTIGDLTTPSGWGSMFNTFVRPNIAADYIFRAVKGEDIYGRKLFDESDTGLQNGLKFMNYTAKTFVVPPFISSSYRDVVKKQENGAIDLFKKPEAAADLLKTIGERAFVRDYKYNILDQFRYSVRDISENKPLKEAGDVEKRYRHLDSVREDYKAIVRIAVTKGNYQMAKDAKNMIKRRFDKEERRYILDGIKSR